MIVLARIYMLKEYAITKKYVSARQLKRDKQTIGLYYILRDPRCVAIKLSAFFGFFGLTYKDIKAKQLSTLQSKGFLTHIFPWNKTQS